MKRLCRICLFLLVASAFPHLAGTVGAQDSYSGPYVSGDVSFHYQQFPWGVYAGDFLAQGLGFDDQLPGWEFDQAVGGLFAAAPDTTTAFWYAATLEPDLTVDLALLWVRKPGDGIPAGDYAVDVPGRTVLFAYVDGISDFTLPAAPVGFDPSQWLGSVTCEHLFLAISGTVHVTEANARGFDGTFTGIAADTELMLVSIGSGEFQLEGVDVGNEAASWGDVKALFR